MMNKRKFFNSKWEKIAVSFLIVLLVLFAAIFVYMKIEERNIDENLKIDSGDAEINQVSGDAEDVSEDIFSVKKLSEDKYKIDENTNKIKVDENLKGGSFLLSTNPDEPNELDEWITYEELENTNLDELNDGENKVYLYYSASATYSSVSQGDVVNYTPTSSSHTTNKNYTGYSSQTLTTKTSGTWKVFYKTSSSIVVALVGGIDSMYLKGYTGYLYGCTALNNACSDLYSNSTWGAYARSMTVDDLNTACGVTYSVYSSIKYEGYTYGDTKSYTKGTFYNTGSAVTASEDNPVTLTQTYYTYNPNSYNSTAAAMLVNSSSNWGWLASKNDQLGDYSAYHQIFGVCKTGFCHDKLYNTGGTINPYNRKLMPVFEISYSKLAGDSSSGWSLNTTQAGSLSVSPTSLTLDVGESGTVTATRSGTGTVSAVSSDTSVATVSVSGTTITVNAVGGGTATITVSVAATSSYYAPADQYVTVTVDKLDNPIEVTGVSKTFTGSQITLATKTNYTGKVYWSVGTQLTASNYTSGSTSIPKRTAVGSYYVYYYVPATTEYKATKGRVTGTISKKAATIYYSTKSITKSLTDADFTNTLNDTGKATIEYSSSNTSVATVDSSSGLVSIQGAGTTTITATVSSSTNYSYSTPTASYTLTVTKANGWVTLSPSSGTKQYGDYSYSFTVSDHHGGTLSVSTTNGTATVSGSTVKISGIGTVSVGNTITVTVTSGVTDNYYAASATYTITVVKGYGYVIIDSSGNDSGYKTYGVTSYSFDVYYYSGSSISASSSSGTAYVSGSTVTVYGIGSVNAGNSITVTVSTPATSNQYAASATYTIYVTRASLSATVSMSGYTYGGTKSTPTVSGNSGGGTPTYYYNTTGSNSSGTAWSTVTSSTYLNAGTYYMYAVIPQTTNYYSYTTSTTAFTITPASFTATVNMNGYIYGGTKSTPSVSYNPGSATVTYYYKTSSTSDSKAWSTVTSSTSLDAGTYYMYAVIPATTNYKSYTTAVKSFTISKGSFALTVTMNGYTYGGTKSSPSVNSYPGGGTVTYYYNTTNSNSGGTAWSTVTDSRSLDAKEYYMYAVVEETTNYNQVKSATKKFTIAKATGSLKFDVTEITVNYDDPSFVNAVTIVGDGKVEYSSSNTSVATVNSESGLVSLIAPGTITITARITKETNFAYTPNSVTYTLIVEEKKALLVERGNTQYVIGYDRAGSSTAYASELISTITLQGTLTPPTAYTNADSSNKGAWDVSAPNDGTVMAWIVKNGDMYDLYIGAELENKRKIRAPESSDDLFAEYSECTEINELNLLDTSRVKNMQAMFENCSSLENLDVTNFVTNNVWNMNSMFSGCSSLKNLDATKFVTSNVEDMSFMFKGCSVLTNLDVTNFDTKNVFDMESMFNGCSSLKNLDVTNFVTSNVVYMDSMFEGCSGLTSLNLSSFNTSNVTDMSSMFDGCSSLTSLDVTNFDTSEVSNMDAMFCGCNSLTSLDLRNFNISNTHAEDSGSQASLIDTNISTYSVMPNEDERH